MVRVRSTAIIIRSDSKGSLMSADTKRPRFPGRELARWIGFQLEQLSKLLLRIINRIRAIPIQKRYAYLAITGMLLLVFLVGGVIGMLLLNPFLGAAVFGLITVVWTIFSVLTANNLKLTLAKAKKAGSEHASLVEKVERLARTAGIPIPTVWVAAEDEPNAFVCGRNPKHAALVVHAGGLALWPEQELEGVLAHEIAHIRNRDILVNTIAVSLYEGISWSCRVCLKGILEAVASFGRGAARFGGFMSIFMYFGYLSGWVLFYAFYAVLMLLLQPLALLLRLGASRQQEYLADRTGAELIGSGEPLARALLTSEAREKDSKSLADRLHLESGWQYVWSTHPPTAKRVELLRQLKLSTGVEGV